MTAKRKGSNAQNVVNRPVLRLRHFLAGLGIVGVVTLFPLLIVAKQVYIRNQSIRKAVLADSLSAKRTVAAQLKLVAGRLSATERIEQVARMDLGLEYPAISSITILHPAVESRAAMFGGWRFLAIVRKSIMQGRG